MGRISKRQQNLQKHDTESHTKFANALLRAKQFIFAVYLTGISTVSGWLFSLLWCGVEPPSQRLIEKAQQSVNNELISFADQVVDEAFEQMKPGATVTIDGSWSTRRNSISFILDVIDMSTKKIIAYVILDKGEHGRKGNYHKASSMMEADAFEKLIPKLKNSGKISTIVKDGDVKLESLIKKYAWNVTVLHDPNHRLKNWPKLFAHYNHLANGTFKGLKGKIQGFLELCLYSNLTTNEKVEKFINSYYHFIGNHTNCPEHSTVKPWKHANDPKKRAVLKELIDKTSNILTDCKPGATTNYNENFHSIKAEFVSKAYNLGNTFVGRYACAILQYNLSYNWIPRMLTRLGFQYTIPGSVFYHILSFFTKKIASQVKRRIYKKSITAKQKMKLKKEQIQKENAKANKDPLKHQSETEDYSEY